MGSSHSVFILMAINLFQAGRVLTNRLNRSSADDDRIAHMRATFGTAALDFDTRQANTQEDDADWLKKYNAILHGSSSDSSYSPEQWNRACRSAKLSSVRVLVFAHYFAGERRAGDLEDQLYMLACTVNMPLLVLSVGRTTQSGA